MSHGGRSAAERAERRGDVDGFAGNDADDADDADDAPAGPSLLSDALGAEGEGIVLGRLRGGRAGRGGADGPGGLPAAAPSPGPA